MSDNNDTCDVCGQSDCPCFYCHGDPKRWLGGTHSGKDIYDEDGFPTGEVECPECNEVGGP